MAFFGVTGEVRGAREIIAKLKQLPVHMRRRTLIRALSAGAGIIKGALTSTVAVDTGLLRSSLGVKLRRYRRRRDTIGITIKPRAGFRRVVNPLRRGKNKFETRKKSGELIATFSKAEARKRIRNPQRYAHLLELGHVIRRKEGGPAFGRVTGNELFRRTLNAKESRVRRVIHDKTAQELRNYRGGQLG